MAIVNGAGMQVPVRDVGEQHVKEDLGRIPTAQDWLLQITPQPCKVDFKIVDGSALVGKSGGFDHRALGLSIQMRIHPLHAMQRSLSLLVDRDLPSGLQALLRRLWLRPTL